MTILASACTAPKQTNHKIENFHYNVDKFADIQILRYRVPGFEDLSLNQKELIYYLTQAALEGRDILYDQNGKYNLSIRKTLEAIYVNYRGDRKSDEFTQLTTYLKRVWMGNGIHHHYSEDKFKPEFTSDYFAEAVKSISPAALPLAKGQTVDQLIATLTPILFDPKVMPKRTNQAEGVDLILTSANNYYQGVTQAEVEAFYGKMKDPSDRTPISYGLNSQLVKENGVLIEKTYKVGGLYGASITKIIGWLEKAASVAENKKQKEVKI